jgi:hypothetical protein
MERFWMIYIDGHTADIRYSTKAEATNRARELAEEAPERNAIVMESVENWVSPLMPATNEGFDD